jgi:hypothetical protein
MGDSHVEGLRFGVKSIVVEIEILGFKVKKSRSGFSV